MWRPQNTAWRLSLITVETLATAYKSSNGPFDTARMTAAIMELMRARQRATKNCNTLRRPQRARRGALDATNATLSHRSHLPYAAADLAPAAEAAMRTHRVPRIHRVPRR